MASNVTKSYRKKYWTCTILSWVLTFVPLIVFVIWGFVEGTPHRKLALGGLMVVAAILVVLNVLMKLSLRCIPWVVLIGIYICLKEITVLLVIMALTTVVDELVLEPLAKMYKNKVTINKEIDKRG
jgi:hypothetical protein